MSNTYLDSRIITLNSDTADAIANGSFLSDCTFNFLGMLQDDPDIVSTNISIQSAQIPISYYNVNEYNKTLKIKVGFITSNITFEEGNYTSTTFITEFTSKVSNVTVTLNKVNGKLTFSSNSFIHFYANGSTCFKLIGLDANTDYEAKTIIAPYACNFAGISRIKVCSNELQTYNMDSSVGTFSNVLATIPVNSTSFGILLFDNTTRFTCTLRNRTINYFDIKLLDDDDNLIDFNNVAWHMTIQLDITRQRSNVLSTGSIDSWSLGPASKGSLGPLTDAQTTSDNQQTDQPTPIQEEPQTQLEVYDPSRDLELLMYQNHIPIG